MDTHRLRRAFSRAAQHHWRKCGFRLAVLVQPAWTSLVASTAASGDRSLAAGIIPISRKVPDTGRRHLQVASGEASCIQRSEEHTSELQSLMRISYAVFCLNK